MTEKKIGRPSIRTDALCDSIIEQVSSGVPLAEICRQEGYPSTVTFYDWMRGDPDLSSRFARAREAGYDQIAVDALKIADFSGNDTTETEDGREVTNHEAIQRSKLRVETRLKLLAKWDPKRYGERTEIQHGGVVAVVDPTTLTDQQLANIAAGKGPNG